MCNNRCNNCCNCVCTCQNTTAVNTKQIFELDQDLPCLDITKGSTLFNILSKIDSKICGLSPKLGLRTTLENSGQHCILGGTKIELFNTDTTEVLSTSYVCGENTQSILVKSDEPAGVNCASGGIKLELKDVQTNTVLSTSYICKDDTVQREASAATITVKKATELLIIENLSHNTTINLETGTLSKKLDIVVKGGSASKTVTITNGRFLAPNNQYFGSNVFSTTPNQILSLGTTVDFSVETSTYSVLISYWSREGIDSLVAPPTNIAHVDEVRGTLLNDPLWKPKLNDPFRPFKSYDEATASFINLSATNRGLVVFAAGIYTSVYLFKDHVDIDGKGMYFTDGGFKDPVSSGKNIYVKNFPTWNNTTTETIPLEVTTDAYVNIEANVINADRFLFTSNSAKVDVCHNGKHYTRGTGNGYGNTARDSSVVRFSSLFPIHCENSPVFFLRAGATASFSGSVTIISPDIRNVSGYPINGYYGSINCDTMAGVLTVIGDINYGGINHYQGKKAGVVVTNTNSAAALITVRGNINGGKSHGYAITYRTSAVNIKHTGDIISEVEPIYTEQQSTDLPGCIMEVNKGKIVGRASRIGKQRDIRLYDCDIKNVDTTAALNSPLFTVDSNATGNQSFLTMFRTTGSTAYGTSSSIVNTTPTGFELRLETACHFTCALGPVADAISPSGYNPKTGSRYI